MYKILIVEDDLMYAKDLGASLQKYNCEILPFADNLIEAIQIYDTLQPTLVLIDIELKGAGTGIDFARYIKKTGIVPFIFLSQYYGKENNSYFHSATDVKPYNYLPKGAFTEKQLWHFVEVALNNFAYEKSWLIEGSEQSFVIRDVLYLKNGYNDYKLIPLDTITVIEVVTKYCVLRTETGSIYNIRKSLTQVATLLQETPYLIQISQHCIVNATKITRFLKSELKLWITDSKDPLEIGRSYSKKLFSSLPHTI